MKKEIQNKTEKINNLEAKLRELDVSLFFQNLSYLKKLLEEHKPVPVQKKKGEKKKTISNTHNNSKTCIIQ